MTFSSSVPARVGCRSSPPSRGKRQLMNGGINSREKVSRIALLSIVLVLYSGITVGLILWNQSGSSPAVANPEKTGDWVGDGHEDEGRGTIHRNDEHRRRAAKAGVDGIPALKVGNGGTVGASLDGSVSGEVGGGLGGDQRTATVLQKQQGSTEAKGGEFVPRPIKPIRSDEGGAPFSTSPLMDPPFDVTLVSQTSQNRFWMLPFLCKRWPGPISIAILEEDREALPEELCSRMLISSTKAQSPEELDPVWYPVNRLRNVAVRAVTTTHFLMTDIDIWPDINAYQALHMRYRLETERLEDARNAIVFSAFSRRRFCEKDECIEFANDVPETITELKPCLESNTCGRFDAANQSGQGTAYVYYWRSMLRQPNQRTLEHILCFKSHRFEPYLVVRKSPILPAFDERFSGYGKNKIQWINHLRYSGFSFYVMPVNFVIHAPHPKSVAKTVWEKTGGGKQGKGNKIMDQIFETFMKELREEKGDEETTLTGLCQKDRPSVFKEAKGARKLSEGKRS